MQPSRSEATWLAANLDGQRLLVWEMSGRQAAPAQVFTLEGGQPAAVADALRQAMGGVPRPVLLGGSGLAAPRPVPLPAAELTAVNARLEDLTVHVLPGVSQAAPCGVMQGAVARVCGFIRLNPDWDGVICLPGPVTHWVQVSAREIVSFQSALTWQLAAAAAQGMALDPHGAWDKPVLAEAAGDGLAKPELLAARLAAVQAAASLGRLTAEDARARLWGLLLGAELAAARPYWLGQNLALIADDGLRALYTAALDAQALPVTVAEPVRMALEGVSATWPG